MNTPDPDHPTTTTRREFVNPTAPAAIEKRITRRRFGSVVMATAAAPGIANRARAAASLAEHTPVGDGDVGATLSSGKPYFPMLLGNGMEHVLIGYSGAMGACAGHEHWSYGTTDTGWFRPDRRTSPSRGVLNLLQCGYIVRRGIHADGIDTAEQVFDARSGSLVTECRFANAGIRVRTFLTANHLLMHRFNVSTNAKDIWMQFFVRTPFPKGPLAVGIDPDPSQLPKKPSDCALAFIVRGEGWASTAGRLLCDHPRAKRAICYNQRVGIVVPLQGESEFTFVVQCANAGDKQDTEESIEPVDRFDYPRTLDGHQTQWQKFDARSAVQVSHGAIDKIYRTSLYTVRAHQHPEMGGITVGAYPGMWSNGVNSYDVSYSLMALLGANRMDEAERVVRFWQQVLPQLRQRAKQADLPGMACPAPMSPWGESVPKSREQILEERHFITANVALHVWQLYQYSGRCRLKGLLGLSGRASGIPSRCLCRGIPWSHLNVSAALSRLGRPGAPQMLEAAARFTTTLHGLPEAVRPDGVYYKTWYPTVHAAFVHAVNLLLVRPRGELVELFAGLPPEWGDASFRSLRVPKGLLINASRIGENISAEVTNDSDQRQSVHIHACGSKAWQELVSLEPGKKMKLPS